MSGVSASESRKPQGFTLLSVFVVIAIIGILTCFCCQRFRRRGGKRAA